MTVFQDKKLKAHKPGDGQDEKSQKLKERWLNGGRWEKKMSIWQLLTRDSCLKTVRMLDEKRER